MAIQNIDIGTGPNTETGDDARTWAQKSNSNFAYLQQLIINNNKSVENSYTVPPNNTTNYMISDQANQTANKFQFVGDASDDPTVTSGSAYYEYLGTTVGDLTDYRRLSDNEVITMITSPSYRQFEIKQISESIDSDTASGQILVEKNGSDFVTKVLFDSTFSSYLLNYEAKFDAGLPVYLKMFNKTEKRTLIAKVLDFELLTGTYMLVSVILTENSNDHSVGDKVEVFFDIDNTVTGGGDMLAAIFDPTAVAGDAFSMDNMVETATKKILTDTQQADIAANKNNIQAITSSYSRRKAVIDIVDNTAVPPTEISGDRYILYFTGVSHTNWDGAASGDIVEFNGTTWDAVTPLEGYISYLDTQNKDALYVDDGTPNWEIRPVATSNGIHTDVGNEINGVTSKTTPVDADAFVIEDSASSWVKKKLSWANIKATLKTYFDTLYLGTSTKEEDIKGKRITNSSVTGTYTLDWDAASIWELTLTGVTVFSDNNLPTGTDTQAKELIIKGDFPITLPSYYEALPSNDSYDGVKRNHFVLSCINGTGTSEDVLYQLETLTT